jgi:hypothetical protein
VFLSVHPQHLTPKARALWACWATIKKSGAARLFDDDGGHGGILVGLHAG